MKTLRLVAAGCGAAAVFALAPSVASAQMAPDGSEIVGHSVQVQTASGATNTIYFQPGGVARIVAPSGTEVQGTWSVANQALCLGAGTARECFPYQQAFQAGQPVTVTSDCGSTATWTALSTAPSAPPARQGERG